MIMKNDNSSINNNNNNKNDNNEINNIKLFPIQWTHHQWY